LVDNFINAFITKENVQIIRVLSPNITPSPLAQCIVP